jgi:hypothetical protein
MFLASFRKKNRFLATKEMLTEFKGNPSSLFLGMEWVDYLETK